MKNESKFKKMLCENQIKIIHWTSNKKRNNYYVFDVSASLYWFGIGLEYYHLNFPDERTGVREYFQRGIYLGIPFFYFCFRKHIGRTNR